jgi:hypothetical protein
MNVAITIAGGAIALFCIFSAIANVMDSVLDKIFAWIER